MAALNRFEGIPTRPAFHAAELSRMVSALIRDVEQFDSLVSSQRQLLERHTSDGEQAKPQWRMVCARLGVITTKVHAVLDEIAPPASNS